VEASWPWLDAKHTSHSSTKGAKELELDLHKEASGLLPLHNTLNRSMPRLVKFRTTRNMLVRQQYFIEAESVFPERSTTYGKNKKERKLHTQSFLDW
jgi:hypothetical protein